MCSAWCLYKKNIGELVKSQGNIDKQSKIRLKKGVITMRGYTVNGKSWIDWEGRDKEEYQNKTFMHHLIVQITHQFAGENGECNIKNITSPPEENKKHPGAATPLGA